MSPAAAQHCSTHVLGDLVDRHRDVAAGRDTDTLRARPGRRATARPRRGRARRRRARAARSSAHAHGQSCSRRGRATRLVELEVALGEAAPSRTRRRVRRPAATSRSRSAASSSTRRSASRSACDVAGRHEQRVAIGAGRRSRSPRSPTRRPACPRPSPSSSTTPNDSPCSDGAQNTVAPRSRAFALGVGDRCRATRRSATVARAQLVGLRARSPTTHSTGVAVESRPRVEQHRETLARLVPADEEHRRAASTASAPPSRSGRSRCRSTARRTRRRPSSRARSRAPTPTRRRGTSGAPSATAARAASTGASSSPDAWNVPTIGPLNPISALRHGPGTARLVQVHDVGFDAAQRLGGAPRGRAARRDRRDRTVRAPTRRSARRDTTPGSGGGPSHGADDAHVDAELAQLAREPEHLALHAAGARQRVRATSSRPACASPLGAQLPIRGRSASSAAAGATARAPRGSAPRTRARAPG